MRETCAQAENILGTVNDEVECGTGTSHPNKEAGKAKWGLGERRAL